MVTREEALNLLMEYTKSRSLIKHALAVEAAMRGYAKKYNEDVEYWGITGLIHDLDYEMYPKEHPLKGVEILKEKGYPEDIINAVKGHADNTNTPRETLLAKVLYAVDELSSFIIAYILVRPNKSFEGIKVKSIKKKLKDKAFARGVDREIVKQGAKELGVEMDEHIKTVIEALVEREKELNKIGESLI
ncbi:HD domain-containing protein [Defluviitalea phaphyphila]|uniref:HD domain-containing protein n=1 Tax=Defluviitalea phaphyphila TaxID=1473580 RepID=UPI0007313F0C|nr:HD domain-containing protein [Defluviitalea phaphyphila]